MLPYLAIALTRTCNFRCPYCVSDGSGEASASGKQDFSILDLIETINLAYKEGIRRFRFTGGEPLLYNKLMEAINAVSEKNETTLTIDTNGSFLGKNIILDNIKQNTKFVVSLDTLEKEKIRFFSGVRIDLEKILKNIETLSLRGLVKRINMVVCSQNIDEVFPMISFCQRLGVDLKLSDVAKRNSQKFPIELTYCDLSDLYEEISRLSQFNDLHEYSQSFGIPMQRCKLGNITVTLKNKKNGARYSLEGACKGCSRFPCDEGLYFVSALPDKSFTACQLNGFRLFELNSGSEVLKSMILEVASAKFFALPDGDGKI